MDRAQTLYAASLELGPCSPGWGLGVVVHCLGWVSGSGFGWVSGKGQGELSRQHVEPR